MDSHRSSSADRLRALIRSKLRAEGRPYRGVERQYRLGHGTLANLLTGRTALKLEHLDLFAAVFHMHPLDLLAEAYGLAPVQSPPPLQPRLRELLRQALNQAGLKPADLREPR